MCLFITSLEYQTLRQEVRNYLPGLAFTEFTRTCKRKFTAVLILDLPEQKTWFGHMAGNNILKINAFQSELYLILF